MLSCGDNVRGCIDQEIAPSGAGSPGWAEKRGFMKHLRLLLLLPFTLVLALMPAAASAAPPEVNHFRDVGTDTDPDFCGTGQAVDIAYDVRFNEWISANGPEDLVRTTRLGKITFTNPDTGLSVLLSFAGQTTDTTISGDPEGLHTILTTTKGLPERIQTVNGPVLLRDAGLIVFAVTFEGDEFISQETVLIKGPHPEAESDFALFCEVMTEALGIG
jgi:hypothetical protein